MEVVKVENDDILSCSQSLYAACESAAVSKNYHSLFDLVERVAPSPEEIKNLYSALALVKYQDCIWRFFHRSPVIDRSIYCT